MGNSQPLEFTSTYHPWVNHPATYREKEVKQLARWIMTGGSGTVIGMSGSGKSDLLGFLCYRPEVLARLAPSGAPKAIILPLDLNILPDAKLSSLYRILLRTFYEHRTRFDRPSQAYITEVYLENRGHTDTFLPQSGLRELLIHFQQQRYQIVFALDRLDAFSSKLSAKIGDNLRGLRDNFKETLSYIAFMSHSLDYLPDPAMLGDLKRLLDQQTCIVGPMNVHDTRSAIFRRTQMAEKRPSKAEVEQIWTLTGGYPSLVMLACRWWMTSDVPPLEAWLQTFMRQRSVARRLEDIWSGLTQEEQLVLTEIQKGSARTRGNQLAIGERYASIVAGLCEKGLCYRDEEGGYRLFGRLFAEHVSTVGGFSRGKIWLNRDNQTLYHGNQAIANLTPKEEACLSYLAEQPYIRHTYTDIIVAAWSEQERYNGVANDSVYQVFRTLRQKIEPTPSKPVYVVNWRGKPEGGYLFYPEGRPR